MEEEVPDFINNLPHDVQLRIVSMLPLKEAIRTSVLSSHWRSFWQPVRVNLSFPCSSSQFISSRHGEELHSSWNWKKPKQILLGLAEILNLNRSYYDYHHKLKICLESGEDNNDDDDFLAVVTKGADGGELNFEFSGPELMFAGKFNLILEQDRNLCCCCCSSRFSSLKSLRLRFVAHRNTEDLVKNLFSSCQFLENLTLENCSGLQNIDIKTNSWCFENLTIADCFSIVSITISAPGLRSFSYRGILPNLKLTNSTSYLTEVTLNLRDGFGHNSLDCEDVLSLLLSLKDVEILTLSGCLLEWLCSSGVIFSRLDFKFSKLKELWWIDSEMDSTKRDSFACFLNMTPALQRLFVKIDENYVKTIKGPYLHAHYWHEPHLWQDYETVKRNATPLPNLEIIKMIGFRSREEEVMLLMDLLLHKAVNLQEMIFILENDEIWRVAVIPTTKVRQYYQNHRLLLPSPINDYSSYVLIEVAKDHSVLN